MGALFLCSRSQWEPGNIFMSKITLINNDCLIAMKDIPDGSIDMILCDLPYGTTQNKWDSAIPLTELWKQYKRLCNSNSVIALCGSQPFSSILVCSNLDCFKYEWVWDKVNKFSGHLNAKKQPMRQTERIHIFSFSTPRYFPIMEDGEPYIAVSSGNKSSNFGRQIDRVKTVCDGKRYPRDLLKIKGDERGTAGRIHPTQKPVALMEYLIKTYTNEGETVLDNCMGSGTTGVACKNLNRNFIGIELDPEYFKIAEKRIGEQDSLRNKS
jgi:site-specific DNA-methyltransferase (adenine-specific)